MLGIYYDVIFDREGIKGTISLSFDLKESVIGKFLVSAWYRSELQILQGQFL